MNKTTRREFIKKSGFTLVTVGLSQRAFLSNMSMAANSSLTRAAALSSTDNIFVVIQLAGGNDGINTVIPMSGSLNSTYRQLRPGLAVPQEEILPIGKDEGDNEIGLHPSLSHIRGLVDQKRAAVIQAVGYPSPNRSHFSSMDYWHTAAPGRIKGTGWLGDYLDACAECHDNPLVAVYIGGTLPRGLVGEQVAVPAIGNVATYRLQMDTLYANPGNLTTLGEYNNRIQTFLALNRELAPERTYWDTIGNTAFDAYDSALALQAGVTLYQPDPAIVYPNTNPLARAMQQVAQVIAAGQDTKILYVTMAGFDTHQNQSPANGGGHPLLLGYLDEAVDVFYRDMQRLGKDDKVLMMTWSEFGRLPQQNGNGGTDHGASAPLFVIGTSVKGGVYGEHPSLTDLNPDRPDTKFSIDFRQVYATILENWMGGDSTEIFGGPFEVVPFL